MININNKTEYEALGFVEALIAIMVVGISSVVLMDIASRTMQEVIQNETIDTMTQLAVEGAEMAQEIAKREFSTGENLFQDIPGVCYVISSNGGTDYYFEDGGDDIFDTYTYNQEDRNLFIEDAMVPDNEDYFRLICLDNTYDPEEDDYVITTVVVGLTVGDGTITRGNLVSDYEYFTVINLK